jgi:hypothetical protein
MSNSPIGSVSSPSAPTWENWSKNLVHRPASDAASQQPSEFYAYHEDMELFRGREHQCKRAEAFVVHSQGPLPPVAW